MSSPQESSHRTLKAKKAGANPPSLVNPGPSGPTTFFLKSEKDVVTKSTDRGRKMLRASSIDKDADGGSSGGTGKTPLASLQMRESSYGVQSLEDAISSTYSSDNTLSRTNSDMTDENAAPGAEGSPIAGRKRKAGNPVHPRIAATGQRIISSEHPSAYTSATGSPVSFRSSESPLRGHLRRGSATSSINLSLPLTPLKGSPHPESALPGTPRSGSPKSFRLSDEEISVGDDKGSQAVASSSGDEDGDMAVGEAMPQLVMPSIAMPARRPFTERGRRMGRLRVMVVGPNGSGKTSLVQSICRVGEDVVHVDPVSNGATRRIQEIGASTKPYPRWRSDLDTSQRLRRASVSEGVLERNVTFIDTPGWNRDEDTAQIRRYVQENMAKMLDVSRMSDSEALGTLTGDGGLQIDAVLFLDGPSQAAETDDRHGELLRYLSQWSNIIPVLGYSDARNTLGNEMSKEKLEQKLAEWKVQPYLRYVDEEASSEIPERDSDDEYREPFAVSSAPGDDSDTLDASTLMSSSYLPPLIPSELTTLVRTLLEPENIARMRHLAANKFIRQRHNLASRIDLPKQTLLTSPSIPPSSPAITSTSDEPSKVLVPHASSSYFRSPSPGSASDTSSSAIAPFALENITEPFRQVRLAKWAQDLRRSLDNERARYRQMYANPPADWTQTSSDSEKGGAEQSLTTTNTTQSKNKRPAKGRLGGEMGVIDPRDPLGLLSFSQAFRKNSFLALQIAGGAGLMGAGLWWVVRNWVEVQEWFGLGGVAAMPVQREPYVWTIHATATTEWHVNWLELFGIPQLEAWGRKALGWEA